MQRLALWSNPLLQFLPYARNCSVTDCDGVPSEDDAVPSYLGQLEVQCIAEPETYADWKLRREDEIAAFFEALSFLSEVKQKNPASSHSHQVQTEQGLTDR